MSAERVQRILARAGWGSRRAADEAVQQGRVTINGQVATPGSIADPAIDSIKVDGRRIRVPASYRYLLLNKPVGCVSTRSDPQGRPTVMELVPARHRTVVVPVGRLDFNSEGLLLLTDDGELAQRLAHPRHGCTKTYRVKVSGRPTEEEVDRLRRGVVLDGKRTRPCTIRFLRATGRGTDANSWWEVILAEGRTRQIRDMFFRIRHSVLKLRRVAIGPLRDESLPRGAWRILAESEVEALRKAPPGEVPEPPPPRRRRPVGDGPAEKLLRAPKRARGKGGEPSAPRPPRQRPTKGGTGRARAGARGSDRPGRGSGKKGPRS